jgi:NAD-dependent deacetylase
MNLDNIKISSWTRVIVLTGAGISAESGLRTFRESNGLWENHRVEDVATPEAFAVNPELVWEFYKQRYHNALAAEPNPGHYALAEMERKSGENFQLITQNVDGLHRKAGNKNVHEMHGRLDKCFCTKCKKNYDIKDIDLTAKLPFCKKCGGLLRPDIVWFGEVPYYLDVIDKLIRKCNLFIVVGTSGVVYPAAGFVLAAKFNGAKTVGVNLEQPKNASHFDFFYAGRSGDLLPGLAKHWLEFFDIETIN